MMIFTVFIITLFLPKQPRFRYEFEKNAVWKNKDLISPFSFAILKTNPQVSADKKNALKDILPVYQLDNGITANALEEFANEFDVKWKSKQLNEKDKDVYKSAAYKLLQRIYQRGIIGLNVKHQAGVKTTTFLCLKIMCHRRKIRRMFLLQNLPCCFLKIILRPLIR
ncbi:hypothetical protein [Pedobacter sp. P26]|uniref:hypothetical protein n=1 Tax=Pedobacter sp. P26 TaxID=3423956 RepID=UPI003D671C54